MTQHTIGSMFAGIGGLDLGVEAAFDARTIWQVEKEPRPRAVLARHWPDAQQYTDVTELSPSLLESPTVILAGFPCQDLSVAGQKAGLKGSRSGLYSYVLSYTKALRPPLVFIENVPPLLKHKAKLDRDFDRLGYYLRWAKVSAADVGAPHLRRRIFVLAVRKDLYKKRVSRKTRASRADVLLDVRRERKRNPSLWATPTKACGSGGQSSRSGSRKGELLLAGQARQTWPTPLSSDADKPRRSRNSIKNGGGAKLLDAVAPWPTPTASEASGGGAALIPGTKQGSGLTYATRTSASGRDWPTPNAKESNNGETLDSWRARNERVKKYSRPISPPLSIATRMDVEKELKLYPTPAARDFRSGAGASDTSHPGKVGSPALPELLRGRLNPDWIEPLMGFPVGWTDPRAGTETVSMPWPAGRGAAQHDWEPARLVVGQPVKGRPARIKALGNAVVPAQAAFAFSILFDPIRDDVDLTTPVAVERS